MQLADGERITFVQQLLFSGPLLVFTLPVLIPLLTMKLFSEERKMGTFETLICAPVTIRSLVLAKFIAVFVFYLLLWIPHPIYVFGLNLLIADQAVHMIQPGVVLAGFIGVMLVGALYCAIGLMMSALTSNQVIAALSGFTLIFTTLLFFMFMGYTTQDQSWRAVGGFSQRLHICLIFHEGIGQPAGDTLSRAYFLVCICNNKDR